jgi:hypothetical protein
MYLNIVRISIPGVQGRISKTVIVRLRISLFSEPIEWLRKPYRGLDGHGTSPNGRCEGSPESSEVSTLGKLSVFSKSLIGSLGKAFVTVLKILTLWNENV